MLPHLNFGVLGTGRYGAKICAKLESMGTVKWAVDSNSDFTSLKIPDWVFIATPNVLHYEQAEYFLKSGANVFVEKPATLNPAALEELIELSSREGRRFYVDDVFLYRTDVKPERLQDAGRQFCWHKSAAAQDGSLLDRLAYHHLYLLYELFDGRLDFKTCAYRNSGTTVEFDAEVNGERFTFSYGASTNGESSHITFGKAVGKAPNDALADMLTAVINGSAVFSSNHKRALWTTRRISEIKKVVCKNIAIVGGGVFGSTIAIELASQGYNIVLYERHRRLLQEASSINQYRVHEGYHYPRSLVTALECQTSASGFARYYRQAIVPNGVGIEHYYAIASENSLTSPKQFVEFMDSLGLPYKKVEPLPGTALTVAARENIFDPAKLTAIIDKRLKGAGVELRLGRAAFEGDIEAFDFTVIATYANLNDWSMNKRKYQYELCEKPVLKLPSTYGMKSIVIMDGPFMCIDPLGSTGMHVMGNVVHAIHHSNIGYAPVVPPAYEKLLNRGIIKNPPVTHIRQFIGAAQQFFPDIQRAEHVGSMYTIRTVLPYREKDDARPTLVEWIGDNRLMVFSGKICTCVSAAAAVVSQVGERVRQDAAGTVGVTGRSAFAL